MLNKFWNYKLLGLIGLFNLFISRTFEIISNKYSYFVNNKNLGFCGSNVSILRGFKYRFPKSIKLYNNVSIGEFVSFTSELNSGYINLRKNVVIGRFCKIDFSGGIEISSNSLLSENVSIQTHDHGVDPRSLPIGKPLIIGENVWIGMNSIILSNCNNIGSNSIIGAGSIVTKDIPSNVIVAGNPAKIIKYI